MARELAAAAHRWRAALIDEHTGQLKDLSVAYRPRRLLDLTVRARDQVCCFPGCHQPARRCDLDHTIAHSQHGRTVAGNLGALCRHHRLKTHTSWSLSQPEPSLFIWTSPTCRVHHFRAPPRTDIHLDIRPHPEPPPF